MTTSNDKKESSLIFVQNESSKQNDEESPGKLIISNWRPVHVKNSKSD
jgi:hypothetical protein